MKIALCLSGQPRFIKEAFPYIKENIIDCNPNVDVFIHCWFDEKEAGKKFSNTSDTTREEGNGLLDINTPQLLRQLYKPKAFEIEPQEDFTPRVKEAYTKARDKTNPFATFSMWESIRRCNNLKKAYEENNHFTYDAVIKGRFDLKITTPIKIMDAVDLNNLHTSGYNDDHTIVEDILFYSASKTMDTIVELPNELDKHFLKVNKWNNELLLYTHTASRSINITRHKEWKFTLARGKKSFLDYLWYYKRRILNKLKS